MAVETGAVDGVILDCRPGTGRQAVGCSGANRAVTKRWADVGFRCVLWKLFCWRLRPARGGSDPRTSGIAAPWPLRCPPANLHQRLTPQQPVAKTPGVARRRR